MSIPLNMLSVLLLVPWSLLWALGGIWLVKSAFRLEAREELVVGFAVGWIVQNWLANLVARVLPVPWGFWAAAGVVFLAGLLACLRMGWRALFHISISIPQLAALALVTFVFFNISRGMAIFDDFAHLPTVSIMATGDIPPHFALDPNVVYGYHYFLLLFSAQTMQVGGLVPWIALDVGRALAFGLALLLAGLFAHRHTGSLLAGLLGGLAVAFASGARWLLLFLPSGALAWLGQNVHLLGSGLASGDTLADAMQNTWQVQGTGPIPFPFAFANGIEPAGVIEGHAVNGLVPYAIIFLLLLTSTRWRSWVGAVLSAVLISVWGLLGEAELVGVIAGWGVVAVACDLVCRSWRLPRALWTWLAVAAAGCVIGFIEGGAWTELLFNTIGRLSGKAAAPSYQTIGFQFSAPAIVSSHLGVLPLYDPRALLIALIEMGPVVFALPLLITWGIKAFRQARWYEAATSAAAVAMLLTVFIQFTGSTGVRNTQRLYVFIPVLIALSAPLVWNWVAPRPTAIKAVVATLGLLAVTGGVVMFGIELVAAQRPVYSYFLTPLDGRMTHAYWNRLEPGALVFDSDTFRAPVIFGRPTNSSYSWYAYKPEWKALSHAPDPAQIRAAGFRYVYVDERYWSGMESKYRQQFSNGCPKLMDEETDNLDHFRRLYDLDACR